MKAWVRAGRSKFGFTDASVQGELGCLLRGIAFVDNKDHCVNGAIVSILTDYYETLKQTDMAEATKIEKFIILYLIPTWLKLGQNEHGEPLCVGFIFNDYLSLFINICKTFSIACSNQNSGAASKE